MTTLTAAELERGRHDLAACLAVAHIIAINAELARRGTPARPARPAREQHMHD
jgi:hypothetical protein